MAPGTPVEPRSIASIWAHLQAGGRVYFTTYARSTVIDARTKARFDRAGGYLLREEGDGYRMQSGRGSVYLLPGQLRYG